MAAERNAPFVTSFIPEPPLRPPTGLSAAASEARSTPCSPAQALNGSAARQSGREASLSGERRAQKS